MTEKQIAEPRAHAAEFSRLLTIDGITPDTTRTERITANDAECAALAARFGLRELANFVTEMKIRRINNGNVVNISGKFSADIVQECVVSLQDVVGQVTGSFETYFSETVPEPADEIDLAFDDAENAPEMIHGGVIDLGEVAAQYLSLDIDPYPRAPGVSLAAQLAAAGVEQPENAFAVLAAVNDTKPKKSGDK